MLGQARGWLWSVTVCFTWVDQCGSKRLCSQIAHPGRMAWDRGTGRFRVVAGGPDCIQPRHWPCQDPLSCAGLWDCPHPESKWRIGEIEGLPGTTRVCVGWGWVPP